MSVSVETNVIYVCRKCGWRWVKPLRVKLTPEVLERVVTGDPFSRPISVPAGRCCKEES